MDMEGEGPYFCYMFFTRNLTTVYLLYIILTGCLVDIVLLMYTETN